MATNRFARVLLTGGAGHLAAAIKAAAPQGTLCHGFSRLDLDISDGDTIAEILSETSPDLLINCAAYNMVDKAEGEGMEDALRVNALGPARLAEACTAAGVPLLHFSTDFVFDGEKRAPYTEGNLTRPLGVYGASKLAGENMVLAAHGRNWVVRVSRLFGPAVPGEDRPVSGFPGAMLALALRQDKVRVVNDQVGSPGYTPDLAAAIWQLLEKSDGGLFQLSNAGQVSFAEYAREIFRLANVACEVEAIGSAEYDAPATRPAYSALDSSKAHAAGVAPLRPWPEALRACLASLP